MPTVSVIMTSYNHERYISDAIRSVLNQRVNDLELIVIDDASVDNSRNILESWASVDPRIVPVYHRSNQGISRTVNDGLDKANGEYLAFLASDDVWRGDKLARQLELLKTERDKVIWTEGTIIDKDGQDTGDTFTHMHNATHISKSGNLLQELFSANFIFGSSLILAREDLNGLRFNESLKYLSDYKFIIDLARTLEFAFVPESLASYRVHGLNSIMQDKTNWLRDRQRLYTLLLAEYGDMMQRRRKAGVYMNLCDLQSKLGDKTAAVNAFLRAITFAPENPVLWLNAITSLAPRQSLIGRFAATIHSELLRLYGVS